MLKTSIPQAWWWWHGDNTWTDLDCESKRYSLWWDYIPKKTFYLSCAWATQNQLKFGTSGEPIPSEFQPPERGIQQASYHCYLVESLGQWEKVESLQARPGFSFEWTQYSSDVIIHCGFPKTWSKLNLLSTRRYFSYRYVVAIRSIQFGRQRF